VAVPHTHLEIRSEREADNGRVRLSGELDLASVAGVEQAVDAALAQGVRMLTLELSGLSFVDSSGLRLFIVLSQRATAEGWKFSMTQPQEQAMTVFRVSGLIENLPFAKGASAA
jgi:anti-sigma B factor antagonist